MIFSRCACRFCRQKMIVRRLRRARAHSAHSTAALSAAAAPPRSRSTSWRRRLGAAAAASAASRTGAFRDRSTSCWTPVFMVAEKSSVCRLRGARRMIWRSCSSVHRQRCCEHTTRHVNAQGVASQI